MEKDINLMLRLNGEKKPDGTIRDTATEIVKGRRDAYERARKMMEQLSKRGKCSSVTIKKILDQMLSKEEKEEYVGVMAYYFKRKYDSLIKQGL